MDFEETMVEENFDEAVEDDTPFDDFVEEDESEDEDDSPEEELEVPDEEPEDTEEEEPEPEPRKEPGYVKQRVQQAVDRAIRETEARMQARFDEQLAPLLAKMAEDEAQELVRSRKVNDIETARELVRLRRGQGATVNNTQQTSQPRNEQGQFVSKEQIAGNARMEATIDMLAKQADKIKANGGPDVIDVFTKDEKIKNAVVNGEMDFYDVAEMLSKPKKKPPTPTRSPNGASDITSNAFANMSSKQFERMERQIDKGVRYTMR